MYKFIEKWEAINREVKINEETVDILESGRLVFRFYLTGYYVNLRVISLIYQTSGVSSCILNLLNETMKELESERDV